MQENCLHPSLIERAQEVVEANCKAQRTISTAESCTGGLASAAITEISGSSAVLLAGYVTYSNEAKCDMLGVELELIKKHGAVSEQVAKAMAAGALNRSGCDLAVSITGIAGPTGGSAEKPVGTVMFGVAKKGGKPLSFCRSFGANKSRAEIRLAAAVYALELLLP